MYIESLFKFVSVGVQGTRFLLKEAGIVFKLSCTYIDISKIVKGILRKCGLINNTIFIFQTYFL